MWVKREVPAGWWANSFWDLLLYLLENEVMYEAGYSDNKAFRQIFRKITGMSPIDYRNKYDKEALAA